LIRLDRLAEVTAPLLVGDVKITAAKPSWAKFELNIPEVAR
jgi:hypothetical protein